MRGKIVLITGATGGIGKETARELAKQGATVVVVGRDAQRGKAALADLHSASPDVHLLLADLSSQQSIRQLAHDFMAQFPRLDVLINNVGGLYRERWETVDGIEATFAVNHLGPFLLTTLLRPALEKAKAARVINVNSSGHRFVAKVDLDNLQAEQRFRGLDTYVHAKLVNLMVTYELARRWQGTGITINIADPGGADTEMTRGMTPDMVPGFIRVLWPLFRLFQRNGMTTTQAAYSSVYLASATEVEGVTGKYFSPKGKIVASSKASYDEAATRALWAITEQLIRLPEPQAIPTL